MKEMICICCPLGCHLKVDDENGYKVTGNTCPKGETYGKEELIAPKRIVTSTVRVLGGIHHMASVKTDAPIPKEMIFKCMDEIRKVKISSPMKCGDIVIKNVLDTGANIVLTRDI